MNRWVSFRLQVVSFITNNDNVWPIFPNCNRFRLYELRMFFYGLFLLKRCLANCFSLVELFQRFWNNISRKISTRLARHHIQRFSASGAAVSTYSNFCTYWICIALILLKQCLTYIQIFGLLSLWINIKAVNVEQEAASAVASVDTKIHIKHYFRAPYWCSHSVIFNLYQIVKKNGIWKISSFYCCKRLRVSLALPLSLLLFTRDTHVVCLQWNKSQCVQIWIFNISNTDSNSFTQTIHLWYKYYSKWICVSFSFQYVCFAKAVYRF